MEKLKRWGKQVIDFFFNPRPTLFDLTVCLGILGISFVGSGMRGFYLEMYAILLVVIGFNQNQKRSFNGSSLVLLGLIGLIALFLHSFQVPQNVRGLSFQYLNFYLQHEGFSYIFFSSLLFYIVVTKATNIRLLVFSLPVISILWIKQMLFFKQFTPILALGVGIFFYLVYRKKYKWSILIALLALNVIAWKYPWITMKFKCRPYVWKELIEYIKHPPFIGSVFIENYRNSSLSFIVGSGYNKLVIPDNLIVIKAWGNTWLYRHNDILSLMSYIGVFALIPIVLFVKELFVRFRPKWYIIPLVAVITLCSFQITFIYPERVAIILLGLSWCYVESDNKGEGL